MRRRSLLAAMLLLVLGTGVLIACSSDDDDTPPPLPPPPHVWDAYVGTWRGSTHLGTHLTCSGDNTFRFVMTVRADGYIEYEYDTYLYTDPTGHYGTTVLPTWGAGTATWGDTSITFTSASQASYRNRQVETSCGNFLDVRVTLTRS